MSFRKLEIALFEWLSSEKRTPTHTGLFGSRFFQNYAFKGWLSLEMWLLVLTETLFTYFNHQIKSITLLNCNMTLIQFVFLRGDAALG